MDHLEFNEFEFMTIQWSIFYNILLYTGLRSFTAFFSFANNFENFNLLKV